MRLKGVVFLYNRCSFTTPNKLSLLSTNIKRKEGNSMKNKMVNLDEVLNQISVIYREKRNSVAKLEDEHLEITKRLRSETDIIKHIEYLNLKNRLDYIHQEIRIQSYIADGMELAREEVFKFL